VFDWNDLKLLLAAYRTRSFGKAAQQLGVSLSTVSRRIEALEEQLGVALFARTTEGLVPEGVADEIIVHAIEAEQAAARVDAASRAARSATSNAVRIAVPPDFSRMVMPLVLPRLFAELPDAVIELIEGHTLSDMPRRAAEIAIRTVRPEKGDDLVVTRLRDLDLGVFASRRYLQTVPRPLEIDAVRWVIWSQPGAALSDWLEQHLGGAPSVLRCSDLTTARLAVTYGAGAGVMSRTFARSAPWLEEIDAGLPPMPGGVLWQVGHRAVLDLPRVRRVWDFLVDTLRDGPDRDGDALARESAALTAME
jgi:DNA-binding transcriptional LysR family regulator